MSKQDNNGQDAQEQINEIDAAAMLDSAVADLASAMNEMTGVDVDAAELLKELMEESQEEEPPKASAHLPKKLTLRSLDADCELNASEAVAALAAECESLEAAFLGDYRTVQLPLQLKAFSAPQGRLIVIYWVDGQVWADVYVADKNDIEWLWSNSASHDGVIPPWTELQHDPNASLTEMWAAAESCEIESRNQEHSADEFVKSFTDSYAYSALWRRSVGRYSENRQPPSREIERLVFSFACEFKRSGAFFENAKLESVPTGKQILKLSGEDRIEALISCFRLMDPVIEIYRYDMFERMIKKLMRPDLPYQSADLDCLGGLILRQWKYGDGEDGLVPFLKVLEKLQGKISLSEALKDTLREIRDGMEDSWAGSCADLRAKIDALVGDTESRFPLELDEAWVIAAEADLQAMAEERRKHWTALFQLCSTATTSKISAPWKKQAAPLVDAIGIVELQSQLTQWMTLMGQPRKKTKIGYVPAPPLGWAEATQDVLRGFAWCMTCWPSEESPRVLTELALNAYRKIPQVGSRAVRVGNACVAGLASIGTADCVAQLSRLKTKVKNGTAQRYIAGQMQQLADKLQIQPAELEEISVPSYGMAEVGQREKAFGESLGRWKVDRSSVQLTWVNAKGKEQKSVPASVKTSHAKALKEWKAEAKDLQNMLGAQRDALESIYLQNRQWSYSDWCQRYLNHPMVGTIARRLIWRFRKDSQVQEGLFFDGQIRSLDGKPLSDLESAEVELWHPLHSDTETIVAWRKCLSEKQITQPFKQAHREIYRVAPAEIVTGTYSNRFAAHIVRQSQYRALAQSRGWKVNLLGAWDGGDEGQAIRQLPAWNLRAEFWTTFAQDPDQYEEVHLISTDQMRFYADEEQEPMPVDSVPELVFSEVMRDADLFVGVASVGNDPNWLDSGEEARTHRDYWNSFAFGDLSESGKTRHAVLADLLPRMKIAKQCELTEKFLQVQGKLRTYKIHLGSSNILMEPDDQYLCIVPARRSTKADATYLPFEGDTTLSLIISKAILLAADDKIKDETILHQIQS